MFNRKLVTRLQAMLELKSSAEQKARLGILLCLFFLPLSLGLARLFLIMAGLFWGLGLYQTRTVQIRRNWLDIPLAAYVVLAGSSLLYSQYKAEGVYNYVHLMGLYLGVYFLTVQLIVDRDGMSEAMLALFSATILVCLAGLYQYIAGVDVTAQRWIDSDQFPELKTRIFATLGNPNVLASFLVMSTGLLLGGIVGNRYRPSKIVLALILLMTIGCILLTYSRGAWMALAVMGTLFLLLGKRLRLREVGIGILGLLFLATVSYSTLLPRLRSILALFNPADSSMALRWALWESTLAMIREEPWLGLGWGSYRFIYPEYDFFVQNPEVVIYHAHNSLLSIAAETGIPAMSMFAGCWLAAIVKSLVIFRKTSDSISKGICLGFFLSLTGMAAFSLTDHVLFNIQVCAVFWSLLAMAANVPERFSEVSRKYWIDKKY